MLFQNPKWIARMGIVSRVPLVDRSEVEPEQFWPRDLTRNKANGQHIVFGRLRKPCSNRLVDR